ncbi:MAG: hypothetical protein ACOY9Y_14830 [Bacillota bacterium]
MLIPAATVLVFRCPACNGMDFHCLSLFSFSGSRKQSLICSCGAEILQISTKDYIAFHLQVSCMMCETKHLWYYHRKELWSNRLTCFSCPETQLDIGCAGPKEKVKQFVLCQERSLGEVAEELRRQGYFKNPEIMYTLMENLNILAETGRLQCQCGNQSLEMGIFPDNIHLRCGHCGTQGYVRAEAELDLNWLTACREVCLTHKGLAKKDKMKYRLHERLNRRKRRNNKL